MEVVGVDNSVQSDNEEETARKEEEDIPATQDVLPNNFFKMQCLGLVDFLKILIDISAGIRQKGTARQYNVGYQALPV